MKKKLPFYKQPDSMDCGPVCLKMISSFYGKEYTLEKLRTLSNIGRNGVNLNGISKAAEKIGFKTLGGRFRTCDLIEKIPLPCILHWNQEHFVVLYDIKRSRKTTSFFIADPGKGKIRYNIDEFQKSWISTKKNEEEKGVALVLETTSLYFELEGDELENKKGIIAFISAYIYRYKKYFTQLILGLLLGSLIQLILPFLTQSIVDTGIGDKNLNFIWLILLAQLMLIIGKTCVDFIRSRILLHISTRINVTLISDFFIKLMRLPMSFFDTKLIGDLIQRIEDHNRIEKFLTAQSLSLLFSLFSFFIFGVVLLIYSVKIFAVFFIGSVLYGLWILLFLKKRRMLDYKYFEQQSINRSKTYQLINGMSEIKLQGCEQKKRWEWEDTQANLFGVNIKSLSLQQIQEAGSIFINEVKNILITILSAASVINGELTLGMMLSIQYIIGQLNSPVEQIMKFVYQWQDVSISLERVKEIHTKKDEENIIEKSIVKTPENISDIIVENLSFRYNGSSSNVLKNINITIPKGKVTAIVGGSGSGKTTLIKLLLGSYIPTEGNIYIGNNNLLDINLSMWRSKCGAVMQDGFIFSDSIANNVAISDEEVNIVRLKDSAKISNVDNFISKLPLSYNTIIGQEGQGLSQGQKQRLLIARAVYKDPNYIFLDEATNALDANNERTIINNLNRFYSGKTVVIVAHRLSTVKNADQIIVLDNGEISEIGNHISLVQKKGKYYQLVKNQLELGN